MSDYSLADALAIPPQPWMALANCVGTDPEAFFPEKGGSTREAKNTCARCPVSAECLDWALETEGGIYGNHGIYGGLSESERRSLKQLLDQQQKEAS